MQERDELELEKKSELQETINKQKHGLEVITKTGVKLQNKQAVFEKKQIIFLQNKKDCERLKRESEQLKKTKHKLVIQFQEYVALWKKVHAESLQQTDITKLEKQKKQLLARDKELRHLQQKSLDTHEALLKAQEIYQKRYTSLQQEEEKKLYTHRLRVEKTEFAFNLIQGAVLATEKTKNEKRTLLEQKEKKQKEEQTLLKGRQEFACVFQITKSQFEKRRSYYQVLTSRGNRLNQQIKEVAHKKSIVHDQRSPSCPTCEQVLSAKRKQFLGANFVRQEKLFSYQRDRVVKVTKDLKELLLMQHEDIKKMTEKDRFFVIGAVKVEEQDLQCKTLQSDIITLERDLKVSYVEQTKQQKHLVKNQKFLKQAINQQKDLFEKDSKLSMLKKNIAHIETQQKDFKYNKKEHQDVVQQLQNVEKLVYEADCLKQNILEQKERCSIIARISQDIKHFKQIFTDVE